MYAIIQTGGKQYKVAQGDTIYVEKLDVEAGKEVEFDVLMVVDGEKTTVGTPVVDVKAIGKVISQGKSKKVIVYKFKAKKNYRKKRGHRQPFTKVEIVSIGAAKKPAAKKPAADKAAEVSKEEKPASKKPAAKNPAAKKSAPKAEKKEAETDATAEAKE